MIFLHYTVQFLVAAFSTVTFAVLFQVPKRHFLACGITGAVGWVVYLLCTECFGFGAPAATLIASLPLTAVARLYAARHRAPVTVFLLCGLFPLVPGAGIYYTVYYFLQDNKALFSARFSETLKIAAALALGIALVCSVPIGKKDRETNKTL